MLRFAICAVAYVEACPWPVQSYCAHQYENKQKRQDSGIRMHTPLGTLGYAMGRRRNARVVDNDDQTISSRLGMLEAENEAFLVQCHRLFYGIASVGFDCAVVSSASFSLKSGFGLPLLRSRLTTDWSSIGAFASTPLRMAMGPDFYGKATDLSVPRLPSCDASATVLSLLGTLGVQGEVAPM